MIIAVFGIALLGVIGMVVPIYNGLVIVKNGSIRSF
jgi:hypothetical protein